MTDPPDQKRLPKNATPTLPEYILQTDLQHLSCSPQSFPTTSFQSFSQSSGPRSPTSSEVEVIMDDGTIQKRSVSLSTLPDQDEPSEHTSNNSRDGNLETTPLLFNSRNQHYQSTHNNDSSSDEQDSSCTDTSDTSSDSDSDDPFFPPSHPLKQQQEQRRRRRRQYHVVDETAFRQHPVWYQYPGLTLRRCLQMITLTPQSKMVLKCSFAYFLASLFTFVPVLNAFIGHNRTSSHLVATATVFFNPAKTLGGMVEAAAYGWGYTLFALIICIGSMITTDYFVDLGYFDVAHAISLIFWLAGSTFIVAFLKAHWNKPPVATASSLCFIIIFIIVVREGSANLGDFDTTRIEQITSAVATGTLITVTSCILFWPVSATKKLCKDINVTLSSYRVLLKLLTKTFLLDDDLPEFKANRTLQSAIEAHRSSFTSLQKSLKEAKLERVWSSDIRGHEKEYEQVVGNMERLAQYIGGLRSSCGLQFELINRPSTQGKRKPQRSKTIVGTPETSNPTETWNVRAGYRRRKMQDELKRQRTTTVPRRSHSTDLPRSSMTTETMHHHHHHHTDRNMDIPEDEYSILIDYISTIKHPLKSLAYTCKQTLLHLQSHFYSGILVSPRTRKSIPTAQVLNDNLVKAIALFEVAQRQALHKLHKRRIQQLCNGKEIDNAPGEEVFLVYFFVFNMVEFARQLIPLVESVGRLAESKETRLGWLRGLFTKKKYHHKINPESAFSSSYQDFIPNERNMTNTLHTPLARTKWRRFFIRLWKTFSLFKEQKIRYAIKASLAATLMATPAFLERTGPWFREWRMEWALITLMVVMTPTVGGTNLVAIYRIFSTILGCYSAVIFYLLFPGNMYALPILTWLFSIPNFWLILNHKHGKFGQFTLLAYNLVMLNKYNDRETDTIEVWFLAFQRCVAILVGVVAGLLVTAYIWPYEARVELRKGMSDFLLRLAWLYQKLVSVYSQQPTDKMIVIRGAKADISDEDDDDGSDNNNNSSEGSPNTRVYHLTPNMQRKLLTKNFMNFELELQRTLIDLQALLLQTPNEPRLKGKFPVTTYRTMLDSCQNIVDKFLSMRTLILKDAWFDEVQRDFVIPVSHERRQLVGNVLLYFYLLASALRLKTPLPPYFPPARQAWKDLLSHLRHLPTVEHQHLLEKDHVYIYYYAYVTMMEDIIRELDKLGDTMTQLFGSLIPSEEWERLFNIDMEQNTIIPTTSSITSFD
ncbi:Fusaric acid resistance protein-like-domain-containing protein [Halteromyces radiatus]|uniref:Fusaric acid resistance protein-like-domain-containing protein n=1 Tax=Halteromyces radiatus TaxID=101107 RepID=UPI00221F6273|nr:Fusaric acid resistance protein-like-domain-containing protein [Halteromyces radiatus]KAI8081545.1 Fusaric acid resistance protein-like-domain-containing protein [Halteromyces radiatus]